MSGDFDRTRCFFYFDKHAFFPPDHKSWDLHTHIDCCLYTYGLLLFCCPAASPTSFSSFCWICFRSREGRWRFLPKMAQYREAPGGISTSTQYKKSDTLWLFQCWARCAGHVPQKKGREWRQGVAVQLHAGTTDSLIPIDRMETESKKKKDARESAYPLPVPLQEPNRLGDSSLWSSCLDEWYVSREL